MKSCYAGLIRPPQSPTVTRLAAARSRFGSNSRLGCYSLPKRRFATPYLRGAFARLKHLEPYSLGNTDSSRSYRNSPFLLSTARNDGHGTKPSKLTVENGKLKFVGTGVPDCPFLMQNSYCIIMRVLHAPQPIRQSYVSSVRSELCLFFPCLLYTHSMLRTLSDRAFCSLSKSTF